jgi:hypothetical protein
MNSNKFWIFEDDGHFSTTIFQSVMGTLATTFVIVMATFKEIEIGTLIPLLIYSLGLSFGVMVKRNKDKALFFNSFTESTDEPPVNPPANS